MPSPPFATRLLQGSASVIGELWRSFFTDLGTLLDDAPTYATPAGVIIYYAANTPPTGTLPLTERQLVVQLMQIYLR